MSQPELSRCRYKYFDPKNTCPHPIFQDGFCIFHLPKLSDEEKQKLIPGSEEQRKNTKIEDNFQTAFYAKLKEWDQAEQVEEFDFVGFRFPDIDLSGPKLLKKLGYAGFKKPADFRRAEFQAAFFIGTEFQSAGFSGAEFQSADFRWAEFQSADFRWAKFQSANFNGAKFKKLADFRGVEFHSTYFNEAKFHKAACFSRAIISGSVSFKGGKDKLSFSCDSKFNLIEFKEKGKLCFEKVNLAQAGFLDTDLTDVVFRDVQWYEPKKYKWYKPEKYLPTRNKALWDEFVELPKGESRDYSKIAENYSQLVINHEKKRDFPSAEQFHIGEMECRQKQRGGINEYSFYRILSNYGTSYWQALAVLVLMLALLAVSALYSGFQYSRCKIGKLQPRLGPCFMVGLVGGFRLLAVGPPAQGKREIRPCRAGHDHSQRPRHPGAFRSNRPCAAGRAAAVQTVSSPG